MVVEWGGKRAVGWRKDRYKPLKLAIWTACAVGVLWSASYIAGAEPGPAQAQAQTVASN